MIIKALIQVRMNSNRYPGKVLAPLGSKPLLIRIIENVGRVIDPAHLIVLTSKEESDDPIASYVRDSCSVQLYRGSLYNVFKRFRDCLLENNCDYFFRICGDSPFLDPSLFRQAAFIAGQDQRLDLITNTFPRIFPAGKTVELIKSDTFLTIDPLKLRSEEKEHVTSYFYKHHEKYRIFNIELGERNYIYSSYTVDTVENLKCLEQNIKKLESENIQ